MAQERYYLFNEEADEFLECNEFLFYNSLGNKITVINVPEAPDTPDSLRYRLEIDDFGCVVGAMNRLIQSLVPTFQFPENVQTKKTPTTAIDELRARLFHEGVYDDTFEFYQVAIPALLVVTIRGKDGAEAARQEAMALRAEHGDPQGVPVWSIIGKVHNEAKLYLPDSAPNDYEILSGPQE